MLLCGPVLLFGPRLLGFLPCGPVLLFGLGLPGFLLRWLGPFVLLRRLGFLVLLRRLVVLFLLRWFSLFVLLRRLGFLILLVLFRPILRYVSGLREPDAGWLRQVLHWLLWFES